MNDDKALINISIPLYELSLWDENARFSDQYFNKTEEELIEYFLSKKNFKIVNLAEEIVKDFDLPQLEKLVAYRFDDKNVILEGNRRLTAYKLLANPLLIKDQNLKKKFIELKNKIEIADTYELECVITDNLEKGYRYIERKHLNNNNEVQWGDNERAHHKKRRGKANEKELLKVEISKVIQGLDFPAELRERVLGPGYVTTFWRLIEQSPAQKIFGFSFDKDNQLNIRDKTFKDKLKVIIWDVLNNGTYKEKLFSRLKVNEIDDYLKEISENDYQRVSVEIEKQKTKNLFDEESISVSSDPKKTQVRSNPKSSLRTYLIPKTCILKINETKINNIYKELRHDLLLDDSNKAVPNAVGVLFRVFLEISLDFYASKQGHIFKKEETINIKIPWVVKSLTIKGHDKSKFNNINKVGSAKKENSYLSIDNFHEYVHSSTTQPTSSELKAKWDNLQEFFEILWKSV
jgi:hypothetical protein